MPFRRTLLAIGVAVAAVGAAVVPAGASVASPTTASVLQPGLTRVKHFTATPTPKIAGRAKVGAGLTAVPGHWRPGKVKLSYRWRLDGHQIKAATHRKYTVRKSDQGHRISVDVRGVKRGYRIKTKHSAAVKVARMVQPAPPVSGPPAPTPPAPVVPPVTEPPVSGPPVAVPPTPVAPPSPSYAIARDGKYLVGSGVQPGLYVTSGLTDSCYWERDSSFDGEFDSIVANSIGSGQRIMRVLSSDYGISLSHCGTWVTSDKAPAVSAISAGVYLVGQQIAPGTYTATVPSDGCYWATLSDFDGSTDSIIANDYETGANSIVDIPASAEGFETNGCGNWTRIG
jgi:hypothetical protein